MLSSSISKLSIIGVTQVDGNNDVLVNKVCTRVEAVCVAHDVVSAFVVNNFARGSHSRGLHESICIDYGIRHPCIRGARVRGSRARLWKRLLLPNYVANFTHIWLADTDMDISPDTFHLPHVLKVLERTHTPLLQPQVLPSVHGGRSTDHQVLWPQVKYLSRDCLVRTTLMIEMQVAFWRRDVWEAYHSRVLSQLNDRHVAVCDFVDGVWCTFAEQVSGQHCLITQGAHVIHEDWGSMTLDPNGTARSECAPVMAELILKFPRLVGGVHAINPFWFDPTKGHVRTRPSVDSKSKLGRYSWQYPFMDYFDYKRAQHYQYVSECVLVTDATTSLPFLPAFTQSKRQLLTSKDRKLVLVLSSLFSLCLLVKVCAARKWVVSTCSTNR